MSFATTFLAETIQIAQSVDVSAIEAIAEGLAAVRDGGGRLFVIGVGGSAAHASHAVNDFRKLCAFESYSPADNAAELTARVNDEGWATAYSEWLKVSRLGTADALLIFSVGGGDRERNVSVSLIECLNLARERGARIYGIVGRDGGATLKSADACVVVPVVKPERVTPHTEGFASVIQHLLVSHPLLQRSATKW